MYSLPLLQCEKPKFCFEGKVDFPQEPQFSPTSAKRWAQHETEKGHETFEKKTKSAYERCCVSEECLEKYKFLFYSFRCS